MAQAVQKRSDSVELGEQLLMLLREGLFIVLLAVGLFVLIALLTYSPADPGWSHTGSRETAVNGGGIAGAWLADVLFYVFGYLAYVVPVMIAYTGLLVFSGHRYFRFDYFHLATRAVGFLLTITNGCGLAWIHLKEGGLAAGGILGDLVGSSLIAIFGVLGTTVLMIALLLAGITLFTSWSWLWLMDMTGRYTLDLLSCCGSIARRVFYYVTRRSAPREPQLIVEGKTRKVLRDRKSLVEPRISSFEFDPNRQLEGHDVVFEAPSQAALPRVSLLDKPPPRKGGFSVEALETMSREVELKLKDFGIDVEVVAVHPGPVITRFELQPAPGVKVSSISNLSKDLARSLSTISVRVVEVIPGKSVIGLEIPNQQRELVTLSEILSTPAYRDSRSPLTLALGKDIGGKPVVADLARMPHLLVAGTTGSGKSVALNAMILSLLFKATASEVRLIMIDPKMLELSVYEGVTPLLAPVVTDMKESANALRWCVSEMERRYRLMAELGVRNVGGYNKKVKEAIARGQPLLDPLAELGGFKAPGLATLPYIVVIVDELADMMMTVGKQVEELIARLAQKARAAGIHLILATQRPSVDVITGLIKANVPSRIAFQVSSRVDSRTILDQIGAENLLGHGDMLFLPPGTAVPTRVHGAFVSDQEVHTVVEELRSMGDPEYVEEILEGPPQDAANDVIIGLASSSGEVDALYDEAVRIVTETRRASISGVQRRLKVGYNRAARMMEAMERDGVVGELLSNGTREVLAPPPPED